LKRQYTILSAIVLVVIICISVGSYSAFLSPPQTSPSPSASPTSTLQPTDTPIITTPPVGSVTASPRPTSLPTSTTSPTSTASPTASPVPQQNKTITHVDAKGTQWNFTTTVKRVVSLNAALTEIVCALGCEDRIVGRSQTSNFPDSILAVPVVGSSSASPTVELVLECNPDVVLADTMLSSKTEIINQITSAGIPVLIERVTFSDELETLVSDLGSILGADAKAAELNAWMDEYIDLVTTRVATLSTSQLPTVYFEWSSDDWKGINPLSGLGGIIKNAGGDNIVKSNSTSTSTTLSPEFVVEANPAFIIKQSSSTSSNRTADLSLIRSNLMSRSMLSECTAIKTGNVYAVNFRILQGIEYPIGQLYVAKFLHPDLFADIDVNAIHLQMFQKFFGVTTLGDPYAYPTS
jgi:iron complex transport system substrate-binding protein